MRSRGLGLLAACVVVAGAVAVAGQEPGAKPAAAPAGDGRVAGGVYVETDADGRADRNLQLVVQPVSPNILHLRGKHGWVAFAAFDADKREYRGFFEWPDAPGVGRPGGEWADLYQIKVVAAAGGLRVEGKSAANELLIRARPNAEAAPGGKR